MIDFNHLCSVMRKPAFYVCENKGADKLFSLHRTYNPSTSLNGYFKHLVSYGYTAQFGTDLVGSHEYSQVCDRSGWKPRRHVFS